MEKRYKIEHELSGWECIVAINYEKARESIKAMVEFWWGWEQRLDFDDGNYLAAFIRQLGREILYHCVEGKNVIGCREKISESEGWCSMDGKHGIKIIQADIFEFDYNEFEFEETTDNSITTNQ